MAGSSDSPTPFDRPHNPALAGFHPLVREWFTGHFSYVTEPQRQGWPTTLSGEDVLISAPTGSGKTLAAFLHVINVLVTRAANGTLAGETEAIYVSPLKALSNDVHKNLQVPLEGIALLAREKGIALAEIRVAVRTGDTPASERRKMGRNAPHILVTTPESLFILLTAEKSRQMLANAKTLIVDELHAVVGSKRGLHLALSMARLDRLVGRKLQKIGLSATVRPIDEVARFLAPHTRILESGHRRAMDIGVEVPRDELGAVASNEMWAEIYDRTAELAREHRTTLIFVNTRRQAERVAHQLQERLGADAVLPHHGSLSRALRLDAEQKLKSGELRAVVATASLELGIDIGTVDLVCQLGTPRSIAAALQRIGRAGHAPSGDTVILPKGRLFATTRDELIECAALAHAIQHGELDVLEIPRGGLDVLAQQVTAMAACEDWVEDELFDCVRTAYPFRHLSREDFEQVIHMLAEGIATSRGRRGALLHRDQVSHRVRGRRGARLMAITNGGAIPDTAQYQVVAEPENTVVGTLDEDFAVESLSGDVFLLGTTSWRIRRVEMGRVRVEDAHGAAPSVPFWRGEAPGRTRELSQEVASLRRRILQDAEPLAWLLKECALDSAGAEQAVAYVRAGARALGALPDENTIVAERFFDESGGMQMVLHSLLGSRINKAWGLALRKRFCRSFNFELQAAATDNGILLSLSDQHSFPLELVFDFLRVTTVEEVLRQALLAAPMFGVRWKWNASRALAVPRFLNGRKVPPPIQRMRSDDLLAAVFPDQAACAENLTGEIRVPDHPLVKETISDCLYEAMDLDGLKRVLERIESGTLRTVAIDTPEPSPFCHEILNANPYAFLDDAPLEERRARAVSVRRTLAPEDAAQLAALDANAIAQVARESWPVVRNADELHDALLTLILLRPVEEQEWQEWFETLHNTGRAHLIAGYWVAAERTNLAKGALAGDAEALLETLRGWSDSIGPFTAESLSTQLAFEGVSPPRASMEEALAKLESEGLILRGKFTGSLALEFCHRRVLARIHRMTLASLRKEIEPASTAEYMRFLLRWQHCAPGAQLHGPDGALQVLRQLEGYEISAAAWEESILPARVYKYDPEWLDRLCLAGEIIWGRLSPHPALEPNEEWTSARRVRPTRIAPLAIFTRENAHHLLAPLRKQDPARLSPAATDVLAALEKRGASFFSDLTRSTGRLASEVEDALWELATAGRVTADGFENLRALLDPQRRAGQGRGRMARPRHAAGRWDLLHKESDAVSVDQEFFAKVLLDRWGVVFRDVIARETLAPPWRMLLQIYRKWEARGEVRGGRFVTGFIGEQFCIPEALDVLRGVRREARRDSGQSETIRVALADPLNLTGIILPGPRTSTLGQGWLTLRDGVPVEGAPESKRFETRFGTI